MDVSVAGVAGNAGEDVYKRQVRELFGNGTLLGTPMFGPEYQPALILALPPGAFMLIGFMMAGIKIWNESRERARQLKGSEG